MSPIPDKPFWISASAGSIRTLKSMAHRSQCTLLTEHGRDKGNKTVTRPFNENLLKTIRLTREMLALADEGDRDRNDDSCGIIYGILRDSAYRLRNLVEVECEKHKTAGKWDA